MVGFLFWTALIPIKFWIAYKIYETFPVSLTKYEEASFRKAEFDDLVPRRRRFLSASVVIPKASATSFGFTKDMIT